MKKTCLSFRNDFEPMLTVYNNTSALNESGSGKVAGRRALADHLVLLTDAAFS